MVLIQEKQNCFANGVIIIMPENYQRDKNGKLIAYQNKPGCAFGEVLAIKIEGRMERIESNVGDTRIVINKTQTDIDNMKKQLSTMCGQTRELMNEVRVYAQVQEDVEIPKRLTKVERKVIVIERITKFGAYVIGAVFTGVGVLLGYLKTRGGG